MKQGNDRYVKTIVRIGVLSAIAAVLFLFEIPMFLPWMKLDLSTLPALLAGFAMGPLQGLCVVLIKCLIHIPMGSTAGVGELADLLCSGMLVLPASILYRVIRDRNNGKPDAVKRNRIGVLVGMLISTLLMTIMAVITNRFILLPMYANMYFEGDMAGIINMANNPAITSMTWLFIYGVIPFNLVKGAVISVITFLIYKPLSRLLHD